MMDYRTSFLPEREHGEGIAARGPSSRASIEARAVSIHDLIRKREEILTAPVLRDPAMAIMVTLFIGELQGRSLQAQAVAKANAIPDPLFEELVGQLVQAGLVVLTGQEPGGRLVGLTPIGSARMRSYIDVFPVV